MKETIETVVMGTILIIAFYLLGVAASIYMSIIVNDNLKCSCMKKPIKIIGLIPVIHHCFTVIMILILIGYAIMYTFIGIYKGLCMIPGLINEYINE